MIYNMSSQVLEVHPGDVVVTVCPVQKVTHYYTSEDAKKIAALTGLPEKVVNSATTEKPSEEPVERPAAFPEHLWSLVAPDDKKNIPTMFSRYKPEDLLKNIDEAIYGLDIFPDNEAVLSAPWDQAPKGEEESPHTEGTIII
jgi:hypothetical protein